MVKPEKGKAIIWYTHFVYKKTGWSGVIDQLSHHGGCDVIKGTKWVANNWINAAVNKEDDIENWAYLEVTQDPKYAHLRSVSTN